MVHSELSVQLRPMLNNSNSVCYINTLNSLLKARKISAKSGSKEFFLSVIIGSIIRIIDYNTAQLLPNCRGVNTSAV